MDARGGRCEGNHYHIECFSNYILFLPNLNDLLPFKKKIHNGGFKMAAKKIAAISMKLGTREFSMSLIPKRYQNQSELYFLRHLILILPGKRFDTIIWGLETSCRGGV